MVTYKSTGVYLYNKYTIYFQSIFYVYILKTLPALGSKGVVVEEISLQLCFMSKIEI